MSELLGKVLRTARLQKRLTQKDVADYVGVSRAAVGQWESGETEPATLNLINICEFLGLDLAAATGGLVQRVNIPVPGDAGEINILPSFRNRRAGERDDPLDTRSREIPIMETSLDLDSSDNGVFLGAFDSPIDFTQRPPGFETTRGLFAIYVPTQAVAPRFEIGELMFLWSARPPAPGEYVVAETKEAAGANASVCYLFRLTKRRADAIEGETFVPPGKIEIPLDDIKRLHRVVPWTELFD